MAGARLRGRQSQNASMFIAGDQIGQGVPFFFTTEMALLFRRLLGPAYRSFGAIEKEIFGLGKPGE